MITFLRSRSLAISFLILAVAFGSLLVGVRVTKADAVVVNCSGTSGSPTAVTETDLAGDDVTFTDAGGDGYCAIDEAISANSIVVETGVVLTHPQGDADGITITTTAGFQVDSGAIIDVDGKGCVPSANDTNGWGPTSGNVCTIATAGYGVDFSGGIFAGELGGGGGYGGEGYYGWAATNGAQYGDAISGALLGSSGSGTQGAKGGAGGGMVVLTVGGTFTINGTITADGLQGGAGTNGGGAGGGSGGAIFVTANTINSSNAGGTVFGAVGGAGGDNTTDGGGGGGGRISLTQTTAGTFSIDSGDFSVAGGTGGAPGSRDGYRGTVYTRVGSEGSGDVTIFYGFTFENQAYTESSWTFDASSTGQFCSQAAIVGQTKADTPTLTATTITIEDGASITCGNGALTSWDVTATTFSLGTGSTFASSDSGADFTLDVENDQTWTNATLSGGDQGILTVDIAGDLTLAGTTTVNGNLNLVVVDLTVGSSASIVADSLGCQGVSNANGKGPDGSNVCTTATSGYGLAGTGAGTFGGGGAGHGGAGGAGASRAGGATYDSATNPVLFGSSGGGAWDNVSGDGGGLIVINASGSLSLSGSITADGGDAASTVSNNQSSGGGSGGSINITTVTFTGTDGTISASGGSGGTVNTTYDGGGGGGGRVFVSYVTDSSNFLSGLTASGVAGGGTSFATAGSDGTLEFEIRIVFDSAETAVASVGQSTVNRLVITFSANVDITDAGGAGDGLDVISLVTSSGTCTISNADYSATNTSTLTLTVSCSATDNTAITITPTYTTAGSSTIVDTGGSTEIENGVTVAGADAVPPVILTSYTGNTQVGRVTKIDLTFSEQVDVTDAGGSGDGFDAITLENETSGSCSISDSDYANPNTTTQTFSVTCTDNTNTALLFDPQYATAGSSTIIDENGNEMTNGETITTVDAAEPYPVSIYYRDTNTDGTVDVVDIQFSEAIVSGSFSYNASDWTFTTASELNLADTNASLTTTTVTDDTVRLAVSADADETGHSTTPYVTYANNGNVLQDAAGNATESFNESWNVNDGAAPFITSQVTEDQDGDGKIERFILYFSEDPVLNEYETGDFVLGGADATGITLGGQAGSGNQINISLVGTPNNNTGLSLTLAYDYDNGVAGSLVDGSGNAMQDVSAAALADIAEPIITSMTYTSSGSNGTVDRVVLVFTETVTWNGSDLNQFGVGAEDLTGFGGAPSAVAGSGTSTLTLTIAGTTNLTGVSGGTEPTLTHIQSGTTGNRVQDASGNALETFAETSLVDAANPVIISQDYEDQDNNGTIERFTLYFSEAPTYGEYETGDFTLGGADASGLSLGGIFGASNYEVITLVGSAANTTYLDLTITYDRDAGTAGSFTDATGNELQDTAELTFDDNATPVLVSATFADAVSTDGKLDRITAVWSETIEAVADASSVFALSSAANFSDLSEGSVTCNSGSAPANGCLYQFTTSTVKTDVGDLSFAYDNTGGTVTDAAGNTAASKTVTSASTPAFTDGAGPMLASSGLESGAILLPASGTFTLTFSEPIATGSFSLSPSPALLFGSFAYSWNETDTTVTVSTNGYNIGQTVVHTITAPDVESVAYAGTTYTVIPLMPSKATDSGSGSSGGGGTLIPYVEPDTVVVVSPNGGEVLSGGNTVSIKWTASGGVRDLLIYYSVDGGANYGLVKAGVTASLGSVSWDVPNIATENARLKIVGRDGGGATLVTDVSDATFSIVLDTSLPEESAPAGDASSEVGGMMAREEAEARLPESIDVDFLVKVADDGNPATDVDSAVYYIGLDAKRHPFVNAQVFFTWYENFDQVRTIDAATLTAIPLGSPVLTRPGTMLVKIQSDSRTFAVEPGSYTIRWIPSETVAVQLYGPMWNKRVMDIEPTYWSRFTMGSALTADLHPAGSVIKTADGIKHYFDGVTQRAFATDVAFRANLFQEKYLIDAPASGGWMNMPQGSAITGFEDVLFSLQR